MGDATYQETFNEENLDESQEKDPEEMEGAEHPHKENAGSYQDHASDSETGETADPFNCGERSSRYHIHQQSVVPPDDRP